MAKQPLQKSETPVILLPEKQEKGKQPTTQMLKSDILLSKKFKQENASKNEWKPVEGTLPDFPNQSSKEDEISELIKYLEDRETNILVPKDQKNEEDANSNDVEYDSTLGEARTKDGGISAERKIGVKEYLSSGYTRKNPEGTGKIDSDFSGKWDDNITIAGVKGNKSLYEASIAEGTYHTDSLDAEGRILGGSAEANAGFNITTKDVNIFSGAKTEGSMAEGSIDFFETGDSVVKGGASASAVSGEAEAKAEFVANPEKITLGGELGAEVNIVEVTATGKLVLTPRRIGNLGIDLWNFAVNDNVESIGENWDIGIEIGGTASAQVGAQAGAEAKAGYENGKLKAEAGAKIGLGVGAGLKISGGIVGIDKAYNYLKKTWDNLW